MKTIRLIKLTLRDFQSGSGTITADGEDTNVYAANGKGKTRLASAFSWLLFDKDSLGRSDFEIKNLDAQGNEEHGLEHSVEALLGISDSEAPLQAYRVALKKTYREQWTKKRGQAQATFTGHTVDYSVDGVPCQKKDFQSRITEIVGSEDTFRLLTSPTAFPALHWQKQRSLLLEICGDISDQDVIASDDKLAKLSAIMGKRSIDDHRKVVAARRTEINKELEKIPVRIDEVKRGLPDLTGLDRSEISAKIENFDYALNEKKLKLQGIDTGGSIAGLSKKLAEVNADILKIERTHYGETMKTGDRLDSHVSQVTSTITNQKKYIIETEGEISRKQFQLPRIEAELTMLREKWTAISDESLYIPDFKDDVKEVCAACGQSLPAAEVEEAHRKALEMYTNYKYNETKTFNLSKAQRLEDTEARGTTLAAEKKRITEEIETLTKDLEITKAVIAENEILLAEHKADRDAIRKTAEDYSMIFGRAELLDAKAELEASIQAEKDGRTQDADKIKADITILQGELDAAKEKVDRFTRREAGEKRIQTLMAEEKTLAAEFEKLEAELFLTELFIKQKVDLLSKRINSKFEITRFKLFSQNINGGIEQCCEITSGGVGFNSGLNSAARTNAGLDIIKTLQHYYSMSCPVFVDNAESVVDLLHPDCQMIRLIVSERDSVLRVETAATAVGAAA
jgi:energy-coupling factor transporter ATP-binding protein EcfA2